MSIDDEMLLDEYFPCKNMTFDERTECINLILNSKELNDSDVRIKEDSKTKYDLVFLSLDKKGDTISFDGVIGNSDENRMMYGQIYGQGKKNILVCTIYRFTDIFNENNEFNVIEGFVFEKDCILRSTMYGHKAFFNEEIKYDEFNKANKFLNEKVQSLKLK